MAITVRASPLIQGVVISPLEYAVALYADDSFFFLQNPGSSLSALQKLLDQFSLVSGYKVNDQKSVIMEFGISDQAKEDLAWVSKVRWINEGFK